MPRTIRLVPILVVSVVLAAVLGFLAYTRLKKTDVLLRVDSRTGNARTGFKMDYSKLGTNLSVTTKVYNPTGEEWPAVNGSYNATRREITFDSLPTPPAKGYQFATKTSETPLAVAARATDSGDQVAILGYSGSAIAVHTSSNAGDPTAEQLWSTDLLSYGSTSVLAADATYRGSQLILATVTLSHSTGEKAIRIDSFEFGTMTTRHSKTITGDVNIVKTIHHNENLFVVGVSGQNQVTVIGVNDSGWDTLTEDTIGLDGVRSVDIQGGETTAVVVLHDNDKTFQFYEVGLGSHNNTSAWYLPGTVLTTSSLAFNVATKGRYRLVYQKGSSIYAVLSDQDFSFPTPTRIITDALRDSRYVALRAMTGGTNVVLYIHRDNTFRYATDAAGWDVGMYVNEGVRDPILSFVATIDSEDKIHHASVHNAGEDGVVLRHYATPPNGKYDDVLITNHVYTQAKRLV